jgi:LmbE family N-acetylglucosaminyl deacetylase
MANPYTPESSWDSLFASAQPWSPPRKETIVVVPHPDDEILGVGGYIAECAALKLPITVVAVTDGENAYPDFPSLAAIRRGEQRRALETLGVRSASIVRLRLPDSGVAAREEELIERLLTMVSSDAHILAPWPQDYHPDHESCGRAALEVSKQTGAMLTFYFFWTWHRRIPSLLKNLPLRSLALTDESQRIKLKALSQHVSQLEHPWAEPILPEHLLWPAKCSFEVFLSA